MTYSRIDLLKRGLSFTLLKQSSQTLHYKREPCTAMINMHAIAVVRTIITLRAASQTLCLAN